MWWCDMVVWCCIAITMDNYVKELNPLMAFVCDKHPKPFCGTPLEFALERVKKESRSF